MKKLCAIVTSLFCALTIQASEGAVSKPTSKATSTGKIEQPFHPFTAKVTKEKVRMRTESNLHSHIVQEICQGEHVVVVSEEEDFYAVKAPENIKLYIYRRYVLDDIVEGQNVNVRLKPDTNSPVITQLSTGDAVRGAVYAEDKKWLEINPPAGANLYISKHYLEKVGDENYLTKVRLEQEELKQQLDSAILIAQAEMEKPFNKIAINSITQRFNKIKSRFGHLPSNLEEVEKQLTHFQDLYLNKKLAFLEEKSSSPSTDWKKKNKELETQISSYQSRLNKLENKLAKEIALEKKPTDLVIEKKAKQDWKSVEKELYSTWSTTSEKGGTIEDFYKEEIEKAVEVKGIIKPYDRPIKNRPGDYVLLDSSNRPVAYLYSTQVNLDEQIDKEISLKLSPRENHNFALPAYHALSVN